MFENNWKSFATIFCAIAGATLLYNLYRQNSNGAWKILNNCTSTRFTPSITAIPSKVVIGTVPCRNKSLSNTDYNNYTITMLKSVLISAQRDHVPAVDIRVC